MTIDYVSREETAAKARRKRNTTLFLVSLTVFALAVGGLIFYFAPEPKDSKTISFEGTVDFADGRNEAREMIEFTFSNSQRVAFPEKKRVEWSGSNFAVDVEIPNNTGSDAFTARLKHPGYEAFDLESVSAVGSRVKFPPVSLERKWKTGKKPRPKRQRRETVQEPVEDFSGGMKRTSVEAERLKQGERNTSRGDK